MTVQSPSKRVAPDGEGDENENQSEKGPDIHTPSAEAMRIHEDRAGESEPPEAIISLRGVTKAFGSHTVLEDITFDVPKGRITCILGPSGTGKSVLLKNIIGLLQPDKGEIWVDGEQIVGMGERDIYRVRRKSPDGPDSDTDAAGTTRIGPAGPETESVASPVLHLDPSRAGRPIEYRPPGH